MQIKLLTVLALSVVAARQCFVCDGVGSSSSQGQGGNFFDLSFRPEAETAEKDETTLEQDLCNNLKAKLPLSMLTNCENEDDVCFIEKVTGRMEAALEIQEDDSEIIEDMMSAQVTRGCKAKSEVSGLVIELLEERTEGVPVMDTTGKPSLREEVCEDHEVRGLTGLKCTTICTFDNCNASGSLKAMIGLTLAAFVVYLL